jgi:UDP-N-acetylglucosamine 2-epimerase (non-hydrolysing)
MKKITVIIGTRPEAIKLCPLVRALRKMPQYDVHVCTTGQHRTMLDQVFSVFDVTPDTDLDLMESDQSLADLTAKAVTGLSAHLSDTSPDLVIVQGDTTTAFCGALAAYYHKIPVAHVEAGLRTFTPYFPFPEEINRTLISRIADYQFAPTETARGNLIAEGIPPGKIFVTGNTVIDALYYAIEKVKADAPVIPGLPSGLIGRSIVLVTGHRRENFGKGFENICRAIAELSIRFSEIEFVYPVHLNQNVREPVFGILAGHANIHLIEPLAYLPFVSLMMHSILILTDSGGIQEEAPSLGKPVVVMRDTTERSEAVEAGTAVLAGAEKETIVTAVSRLLTDKEAYTAMTGKVNPYGDGRACGRIAGVLRKDVVSYIME